MKDVAIFFLVWIVVVVIAGFIPGGLFSSDSPKVDNGGADNYGGVEPDICDVYNC